MTLAELAALAEEKVPGFKRPEAARCWECGNEMGYCACSKDELDFDNSPAALLMAVAVVVAKGTDVMLLGRRRFSIARDVGPGPVYSDDLPMAEPESIARAALVALLRAHGVEVQDAD